MSQNSLDSTQRFSNRVDNYVRYRPIYPSGLIDVLREETGFATDSIVADIGAGTGISTELFLKNGNTVFAVEPNAEMRAAAETRLRQYPSFRSVAATAEATTLADASVDYVVAGQAFHWFDVAAARREFVRILRPNAWVVLFWNTRRIDSTPFLRDYEALLRQYSLDYGEVHHRNIDPARLESFFALAGYKRRTLYNEQRFDFDGLRGRLESSSYTPTTDHSAYAPMIAELDRVFQARAAGGQVCIEYDTEIYLGQLA